MPKPNLFNYATKGAFAGCDHLLVDRMGGHAFVDALLTKHGVVLTGSVRCTEIHQQNLGIDVLARGVYGNPHAEAAEISLAVCEGTKWSKIDIAFYVFRRKWQKPGARPSRGTGEPQLEMHRSQSAIQECLMIEFIGQFQLPEFQACLQSRKWS